MLFQKKEIKLETLNDVAKSNNGLILKENDLIILTGEEPENPIVNYASEMIPLLNNKKKYIVKNVHDHSDGFFIVAAGWSWDCRNITKITTDDIEVLKPVMFDLKYLDF